MHPSTRDLLLLAAIGVLLAGLWVPFSLNTTIAATVYGVGWALGILLVTRLVLALGSGYNGLRAWWVRGASEDAQGSTAR